MNYREDVIVSALPYVDYIYRNDDADDVFC